MIRVLYINHYGTAGGAQRSILELISAFPQGAVDAHFITPAGSFTRLLDKMGIGYTIIPGGLSKFDHTRKGYYRGWRWLIIFREILFAIPTWAIFFRKRKYFSEFDVVHVNEVTCLYPMRLAKRFLHKPVIVHARAILNTDPNTWQTPFVRKMLRKYADAIIAIDKTVAASIPAPEKMNIVNNSFSIRHLGQDADNSFAEKLKNIPRRKLNLGFIGAIHANKGIFDLLEAIRYAVADGMDISLTIAGNANPMHRGIMNSIYRILGLGADGNAQMNDFIQKHHLESSINLLGFSTNSADFFRYIDVICFPSHYNAIGRPVFEAAYFSKPSIVAICNPVEDTFIEGVTGISVKQQDATSILKAIRYFYEHPNKIQELGQHANHLFAGNFDTTANSAKVLSIYKSALPAGGSPQIQKTMKTIS